MAWKIDIYWDVFAFLTNQTFSASPASKIFCEEAGPVSVQTGDLLSHGKLRVKQNAAAGNKTKKTVDNLFSVFLGHDAKVLISQQIRARQCGKWKARVNADGRN